MLTGFLIYTVAVFVVSCAICVTVGMRRGTFNSAMRLGFFLVSGILAFVITRLLSPVVGAALVELIGSMAEESELILGNNTVYTLLADVIGGLISPLIFLPLFFSIDKLSFIAYVPLRKKFADREALHNIPNDKVYGALLGVVLSFCITLSCVMPIGGYPYFLSDVSKQLTASSVTAEVIPQDVAQELDNTASHAIVKIDHAISGWLFDGLTTDARSFVAEASDLIAVVDRLTSAKDPEEMLDVLSEVSPQSISLLASVVKDSLSDIIDDSSPFSGIAGLLLDGLQDLPKLQKELGEEGYKKELQVISSLVTAAQGSGSVEAEDILEMVTSSKVVQTVVLENTDAVAAEISKMTDSLSNKEKKELQNEIKNYLENENIPSEVASALEAICR